MYIVIITFPYIFVLLLCHGDIEPNPGPKKLKKNSLSVCHWNINSLPTQTAQLLKFSVSTIVRI